MSLLGAFEQRLERAVEGFFARVFRSGVHPIEIGKRILRVMEDGKTTALRRTYVPNVYRIVLGSKDYERLAPLEPKLIEELEIFVSEAARQRDWVLADPPRVSFASSPRLSPGEFKVEAEAVSLTPARARSEAEAEPTMGAGGLEEAQGVLVVLSDDGPLQTVPVDGRIRIGRQADNDLVLPDPGVSRHHAEVVLERRAYVLRDLGSKNGTLVNGSLTREHRLSDGDRFTVGRSVVEFRRA